nr:MAG TPA: Putative endo-beta-N-acetylglucosaminidase surface protein [Bacteriophage sp.]
MGECLLVRRGAKPTLKGISVKTPPAKLEYLAGDTFDPTGLVLTANVGGVPVDVTTGYTVTPDPLTADTTAVTISYTLDGKTATTAQAVTVKSYDPVFANNTWEKIIEAAASGRASELWQVGSTKPYTIGDETYTARIIGFDHDALDATDARYGDASYNGGKNKAAITLEMVECTSTSYQIHTSNNQNVGWSACALRNNTLPAIKATIQSEIRNAIRTVVKKRAESPSADYGKYSETPDTLFILSLVEYNRKSSAHASWADEGTTYAYYEAGNAITKKKRGESSNSAYWTASSKHYTASSYYYLFIDTDGESSKQDYMNSKKPIAIAFCL